MPPMSPVSGPKCSTRSKPWKDADDIRCPLRHRLRSSVPEPLRSDLGALGHRAQLLERDVRVQLAVTGEGAEAPIAARDDPLAADEVGEAAQPLGDAFGLRDAIAAGAEHAGHEALV